eukprot:TRINITY_DN909_c0_g1_i1.p1 TRINITY_DN909_c0_g1~~TRINITY_DN909_c0_g1_i1.p1  ORF type:complete len:166 (-),score=29.94 TRINITY_DN909_c0_g1_i1:38-535(-)
MDGNMPKLPHDFEPLFDSEQIILAEENDFGNFTDSSEEAFEEENPNNWSYDMERSVDPASFQRVKILTNLNTILDQGLGAQDLHQIINEVNGQQMVDPRLNRWLSIPAGAIITHEKNTKVWFGLNNWSLDFKYHIFIDCVELLPIPLIDVPQNQPYIVNLSNILF